MNFLKAHQFRIYTGALVALDIAVVIACIHSPEILTYSVTRWVIGLAVLPKACMLITVGFKIDHNRAPLYRNKRGFPVYVNGMTTDITEKAIPTGIWYHHTFPRTTTREPQSVDSDDD